MKNGKILGKWPKFSIFGPKWESDSKAPQHLSALDIVYCRLHSKQFHNPLWNTLQNDMKNFLTLTAFKKTIKGLHA